MMKYVWVNLIWVISSPATACPQEETARSDALRRLYSDGELVRYVCVETNECSFGDFLEQLDVRRIALNNAKSSMPVAGLQVEPVRKGRQYFSAIFALDQCKYKMVFAPDTAFSDLKVLKAQKNGLYMLRAVEPRSGQEWKEYDFAYNRSTFSYHQTKVRCYRANGLENIRVKCDW